jgi:hypothetical protein
MRFYRTLRRKKFMIKLAVPVLLVAMMVMVVVVVVDPVPVACHDQNGAQQLCMNCQSHWRISAKGARKR